MHTANNALKYFLYLLKLCMAGLPINRVKHGGAPLDLEIDLKSGRLFYFDPAANKIYLPSEISGRRGEHTKEERSKAIERTKSVKAFSKFASEIGGSCTDQLVTGVGRMRHKLIGLDGVIIALLLRATKEGRFIFIHSQELALAMLQMMICCKVILHCGQDVAPGRCLQRMLHAQKQLRIKTLFVLQRLGLCDISLAVHTFVSHMVSAVEQFGNLGVYDSERLETAHEESNLDGLLKQNHQDTIRKNGKIVARGDMSLVQVIKASTTNYVMNQWDERTARKTAGRRTDPPCVMTNAAGGVQSIGLPRKITERFHYYGARITLLASLSNFKEIFECEGAQFEYDPELLCIKKLRDRAQGVLVDSNRARDETVHQSCYAAGKFQVLIPHQVISVPSKHSRALNVLAWKDDKTKEALPQGYCGADGCLGCREGWQCSCYNSDIESYGIPLGFFRGRNDKTSTVSAVVAKIRKDRDLEPALSNFEDENGKRITFELGYGTPFKEFSLRLKVVPSNQWRGISIMYRKVLHDGGHFLLYRKTRTLSA